MPNSARLNICDEALLAKVEENETEEWMSRYGDLVWARIYLAHPWWPAKICDLTELSGEVFETAVNCVGKRYCVYFYGSNNCDFALPVQIVPYVENAKEFVEQKMDKELLEEFQLGVQEANEIAGTNFSSSRFSTPNKRNAKKRAHEEVKPSPRSAKKSATKRIKNMVSEPPKTPKKHTDVPATLSTTQQKKRFYRRRELIRNVVNSSKSLTEKKVELYDMLVKWQESTPNEPFPPFPKLSAESSLDNFQFNDAPEVPMGVEYTESQSSIVSIDDSLLKSLPDVPAVAMPVDWNNVEFDATPTVTHLLHHSVATQRQSASYGALKALLENFNREHAKTLLLHAAREEHLKRMTVDCDILKQYVMVADETVNAQSGLVDTLREQLIRADMAHTANSSLRDTAKAHLEAIAAAVEHDTQEQKRDTRALFVAMAAEAMNMEIDLLPTSTHPVVDSTHVEFADKEEPVNNIEQDASENDFDVTECHVGNGEIEANDA